MASMLSVVLVTCLIFACFQCDRTTGNIIGDTGVREDNNELVDVLQRNKRAAVRPMNDAGNAQFGQQNFANPNALKANNAPQIPNADFNGAGNGFAGGNQAWNAPMAGGQGGGMNPNNFGGPQGNLNEFNMPQNMQNQPAFNQAGMQNNLPGAGQDGVGNNRGGLGKMMAKEMRNRKAQMANAMRPLQIADTEICRDDVMQLCGKNARGNNFAVLDCLQNTRQDNSDISVGCNHFLWEYKLNLTKDSRFDSAAFEVCKDDLNKFPDCSKLERLERGKGLLLPCLYDVLENVTNTQCRQYLNRMKAITFSDYRMINGFYADCKDDITKAQCGSVQNGDNQDKATHKQGETIQCLEKKVGYLGESCKKQIFRVAELSSNDYHLDRALYFACRDDRERFCEKQQAGTGRIYKCLLKHKFETDMSDDCREKLTTRQQVINKDYKANYALHRKCKEEIRRNHCDARREKVKSYRLSFLLVCLETAKKRGRKISGECEAELLDTRKSLMSDYFVNPEVVFGCRQEIDQHCEGGLQREGRTLHCLMDRAKLKDGLGYQCIKALEDLVQETDAGEDCRIDPALQRACADSRQALCSHENGGDGKVLSCLMEHIYDAKMTDECENELLQLQYFVSRDFRCKQMITKRQIEKNSDFRLNMELQKACRHDMPEFCQNILDNSKFKSTELEGKMLGCLKKRMLTKEKKLSQNCENYVKETMEEGAMDYRMDAELKGACKIVVKQNCMAALEEKGTGSVEECLKSLLEQGKLTDHTECQTEVIRLLQESRADIQVDPLLHKACALDIKHYCSTIPQGEGRHMSCLLETLEDKTIKLRPDCLKMLTARKEMWEFAAKVAPPETINDFVAQLQSSPNRNYFLLVFLAVFGTLFFGGMFCGRATKRVAASVKNK